jgi:hypothetical protein
MFANHLRGLPDELCGLRNLNELNLSHNLFRETPVSVFSRMTALTYLSLSVQAYSAADESAVFRVPSSLLPILHPGLVEVYLRQHMYIDMPRGKGWDMLSLFHLGRALADVADRRPVPRLLL